MTIKKFKITYVAHIYGGHFKFPLDSTATEQTELGLKLLVSLVLFRIFFCEERGGFFVLWIKREKLALSL